MWPLRLGLLVIAKFLVQVLKVIRQQAALLPHVDGSMVFARWHQCAPHPIHASLGPPKSKSQMASRSIQPFWHISRQGVDILYNRPPSYPLKNAPSHGESGPPTNTWFLGTTRVLSPNWISISSAVFAGHYYDQLTVCNNRPHLHT